MKGDPCQLQACAIQKCLQVNNYKEAACPKEFAEMRKCCEKWADLSGCCSGFKDPEIINKKIESSKSK